MFSKEFVDRFWSKVSVNGECWEWTGHRNYKGYGTIDVKGKFYFAHRLAYILSKGEIPEDYQICHTCDNRCCIRPEHLFAGTAQDNVDDMMMKGRDNILRDGVRKRSKLTWRQVCEIRLATASGVSDSEAGDWYGVSRTLVNRIRHRVIWRNYHDSSEWNIKPKAERTRTPVLTRITRSISLHGGGCWIWTKKSVCRGIPITGGESGYGNVTVVRELYKAIIGNLENGMELIKTCGTDLCVNPFHYRSYTKYEKFVEIVRPANPKYKSAIARSGNADRT